MFKRGVRFAMAVQCRLSCCHRRGLSHGLIRLSVAAQVVRLLTQMDKRKDMSRPQAFSLYHRDYAHDKNNRSHMLCR